MELPDGPLSDPRRLSALRRSGLLDPAPDPELDRLTRLAARLLDAPTALVSLVTAERQLIRSCFGLPAAAGGARETSLDYSFCRYVVESGGPLVLRDARADPLHGESRLVLEWGIRAYAGIPLRTAEGDVLGTLCVLDVRPREWTEEEIEALADLAEGAAALIELRRAERAGREAAQRLSVVEGSDLGVWDLDVRTGREYYRPEWARMLGYDPDEIGAQGPTWVELLHPEDRADVLALLDAHLAGEIPHYEAEYRMRTRDGSWRWFLSRGRVVERDADGAAVRMAGTMLDITARKHTERLLLRTQEQTTAVLESITDAFYALDGEWRLTYVNRGAARYVRDFIASDVRSVLGRDLREVLPAIRGTAFEAAIVRAMAEGAPAEVEEFFAPFGIWFESHVYPSGDGASVYFRDVTEQKEAREALQERERYYRSLIENASDMITILDADGTVLYESPSVQRAIGWRQEELLGTNAFALIHPEDRARVVATFRVAIDDPTLPIVVSYRFRDRGGVWRELESTGSNLLGDPAVRGVVVTSRDLSERREAEAKIRFQAQLLDAVGEAVIALDAQERVLFWNRFAETLYGYSREEALGRPVRALILSPREAEAAGELWASVREGEVRSGEFAARRRDGSTFPAAFVSAPILDEHGAAAGVVAASYDLTQRRQLEEQLRQAQKMEAVGRLAGGIAHDFNNLLTVIKGHTHVLLEERAADPELAPELRVVMETVERASALTHQLLSFSRKQVLQPRVINFNRVLSDMERLLRRTIGEDVELELGLEAGLHPVLADPGQMEQVILNLAVNARDAMPRGGRLALRTANAAVGPRRDAPDAPAPGEYVLLEVGDTGEGMDAPTLERAFEPFFTTKPVGKGTGLGLSTVYGIVRQSGGHMEVESRPGEGTTFRVYLPRLRGEPAPPPPEAPPAPPRGGSETILVVEDDPDVRSLVRDVLARRGYGVLEAASGGDALALRRLFRGRVDLLLTDVVMPGMSGRELAAQLEAAGGPVEVLFMSGYTDDEILRHGVEARKHVLLAKPFGPDDLLRAVRAVLDAAPERPPPES